MRFPTRLTATLLFAGLLAVPALAADRSTPLMAERGRGERLHKLERLLECLPILDLTDQQRTEIRAVLEAARPEFQAAREAVRAAREKLSNDVETGADACLVGEDYLALRAALESLRAALVAVRGDVLSKLTLEQAAKLAGCLEAPGTDE